MKLHYLISAFILTFTSISNLASENTPKRYSPYSIYTSNNEMGLKGSIKLGAGKNIHGAGKKVCFKADGASGKYILGNDCENEIIIGAFNRFKFDSGAYLHTEIDFKFNGEERGSLKYKEIKEFYAKLGNLKTDYGNIDIWGGKRDYGTYYVSMLDSNLIDVVGTGFGIEKIDTLIGEFSYGFLKSKLYVIKGNNQVIGRISQVNHDFRLSNKINSDDILTLWYNYANISHQKKAKYPVKKGYAAGIFFEQPNLFNTNNKASIQYGTNLMYNLKGGDLDDIIEDAELRKDTYILRLTNQNMFDINEKVSFGSLILFDQLKSKKNNINNFNEKWLSFGIRPMYYLNDNIRLNFEAAHDITKNNKKRVHLTKLTLAGEYVFDKTNLSKPIFRLYVTNGFWSKNVAPGNNRFKNKTKGMIIGAQLTHSF